MNLQAARNPTGLLQVPALSAHLRIAFHPEADQPTLAGVAVFPAPPGCFPGAQLPDYGTASLRGACPAPQGPAAVSPSPAAGPRPGPAPAAGYDALDAAAPAAGPAAAGPLPAGAASAGAPAQAVSPSPNPGGAPAAAAAAPVAAAGAPVAAAEQAVSPGPDPPFAAPVATPAEAPSPSSGVLAPAPAPALQLTAPSPAPACSAQPVYAAFCGPNGAVFAAPDGTVFPSVAAGTHLSAYDNSFSSGDAIADQSGAVSEYMALFQTQCQARCHQDSSILWPHFRATCVVELEGTTMLADCCMSAIITWKCGNFSGDSSHAHRQLCICESPQQQDQPDACFGP